MRAVRGIVAILGLILGFIAVADAAALYFIHPDHLNTPRLITSQVGQAVWRWDNDDPFGNNVPNENPSGLENFTCNLRLPGQYFDNETNAHYNYFRDYDPAIGRYVQSDPIGLLGGINTYAYANSNPLSLTDPAGEFAGQISVAAGIVIAGLTTWKGIQLAAGFINAAYIQSANVQSAKNALAAAQAACLSTSYNEACGAQSDLDRQIRQCQVGGAYSLSNAYYGVGNSTPTVPIRPGTIR